MDRLRAILRSLRRRNLDGDMEDEMRFHIEQYKQDLIVAGMPDWEAAEQSRRAFGNIGLTKESCRQAKGLSMWDELTRNIRYAFRQLRRSPGFAAGVIVTLGLCIGINTAVYSVIDAALFRRLPYPEPERLFDLVRAVAKGSESYSSTWQDGFAWEALKDTRTFRVAASGGVAGVNLGVGNRAFYVRQHRVGVRYFNVLGVPLAYGREFDDAEDRRGGPAAAILSHGIWKRFFHGDPSIVGRTILLRGEPHLVTGIASEGFTSLEEVDVWTPLRPSTTGEGVGTNYRLMARLNPGVSFAEAQAEANTRGAAAFEHRKFPSDVIARMDLVPFEKANQAGLKDSLLVLWAAVTLVLLIGCVNVASLMLARGATRVREMGTRIALGGGRGSLIRQLATESVVLGFAGGAAGVVLGYAAIQALQTVIVRYGIWQELRLDARVLLATAFVSITVSLLFGLAPAIQAAHVDVRSTLLEGGSRSVAGGKRYWPRRLLVAGEVAMSVMLLIGAGLLIRTLLHLQQRHPGFDGRDILTASASLQDARYAEAVHVNQLFRDSLESIRQIPGVQSAAVGLHVPYQRWLNSGVRIRATSATSDREVGTSMNYVTPGYFEVLRIPLRAGRTFDDRDSEGAMPVAVVNETFARKFFQTGSAIGASVQDENATRQIVGVVSDLQQQPGLSRSGPLAQEPALYVPAAQFSSAGFRMAHTWYAPSWIVRTTTGRERIARGIEQAIAARDSLLPIAQFRSMLDERDTALQSQRLNAVLLGSLAGLALLLALVGVYGLVANSVVERTREFGIRMALGSSLTRVIREAVAPGAALSAAGAVVGGLLAAMCTTMLQKLLYGVKALDGVTFVFVPLLLIAVGTLASLLPALSLIRLTPASVLRQD